MKVKRLITLRVILGLLTSLTFVSCLGEGTDQLHGMLRVSFPSTAVCQAQQREVQFRNVSGEDIVLEGAAISGGTDPDGNFNLVGVRVGSEMIASDFGKLDDVTIPPNTIYSFVLSFTPRTINSAHDAVVDVVYKTPQEGVVQIALSGNSTNRAPNCSTGGGGGGGGGSGVGDLDGNLTITINRIALLTTAIGVPITTDPDKTVPPGFQEVELPIELDAESNSVALAQITEDSQFILPPTTVTPISTQIRLPTTVTSKARASGTYSDDGAITVQDVPIHLEEKFVMDYVVTLTTESVDIPSLFSNSKSVLRKAGFAFNDDQSQIVGSRISETDHKLTLVGISNFSNIGGTGIISTTVTSNTLGAVVIDATINVPQ